MEISAIVAAAVGAVNAILDIVEGFGKRYSRAEIAKIKLEIVQAISDREARICDAEAAENRVLNG